MAVTFSLFMVVVVLMVISSCMHIEERRHEYSPSCSQCFLVSKAIGMFASKTTRRAALLLAASKDGFAG
jgi:hypothetical protein